MAHQHMQLNQSVPKATDRMNYTFNQECHLCQQLMDNVDTSAPQDLKVTIALFISPINIHQMQYKYVNMKQLSKKRS